MSTFHAKLSPSGAHRWMACAGSVVLEAAFPNTSSRFADEGTAAHELAAKCLISDRPVLDFFGEKITVNNADFFVDAEMARHVQDYVNLVKLEAVGGQLLVEQRVPIGQITGETGAGGTADSVILMPEERVLKIVDLKYGMGVKVDALDNPQLMLYALGAVDQYSVLGDFDVVTMVIHQPRLNHVAEFHVFRQQLEEFRAEVTLAAQKVDAAHADVSHAKPTPKWVEDYLQTGRKQCRFCRAKATCPALRSEVVDTVGRATAADFASLIPAKIEASTEDDYMSTALDKIDLIEGWCAAVRSEASRRLIAGETITGYKLVRGRSGNSQWTDEKAVAKLFKSFRLRNEEMFDQKLISPTKAKKLLEGNPRRVEKIEKLITRPAGKPSVVHATDKRPEMVVSSVADDFRDLIQTAN